MEAKRNPLKKFLSVFIPFFVMPSMVITGLFVFRARGMAYMIAAVTALTLIVFLCGFEKRKTGTRRLVLTAVFIALASIGRVICSPLPGVNPITAITVLAAVYLGGEAGFMIGSLSALISNIVASQGTWSAFQMLAWGIIGMVAGLLSRFLEGHRLRLCVYTFTAGAVYSLIMDIFTVIWASNTFSFDKYAAAIVTAIPFTLIYSLSNILFTFLLEKPFREKLGRIKMKYDI